MQNPRTRTGSSEVPHKVKVSPCAAVRQLRPAALHIVAAASSTGLNQANKAFEDRSTKVTERRSPRNPVPERKRPSRISELESQVSQLKEDIKKVREQFRLSEICKRQAKQDAKESKEKLFTLSLKLEESQQQFLNLSATGESHIVTELPKITQLEAVQKHNLAEPSDVELVNLKQNLEESLSLVEKMKNQDQDQALVNETLRQLEAAKRTVESLRADATKYVSRARVNSLEALVKMEDEDSPNHIEAEIKSALESAETKYQEEHIHSTMQIRNAYELVEKMKSESRQRESELMSELKRKNADIEELKANLMDKETKLQCVVEENEKLNNLKLENIMSFQREHELKRELKRLDECVAELKTDLMDKEETLRSVSEENEMLKMEINKRFAQCGNKVREEVAEGCEAVMKLRIVMEEADRSNRKAAKVAEHLEVAKAANSEIEAELRRLKVQADQWRKAAEAAAAMVSTGNNGRINDRSLSLDNNYKPLMINEYSSYCEEDIDDYFQRKKNGNMLKKIGVMLKKPKK